MFSTSLQCLGLTFSQRFKDVICPLGRLVKEICITPFFLYITPSISPPPISKLAIFSVEGWYVEKSRRGCIYLLILFQTPVDCFNLYVKRILKIGGGGGWHDIPFPLTNTQFIASNECNWAMLSTWQSLSYWYWMYWLMLIIWYSIRLKHSKSMRVDNKRLK